MPAQPARPETAGGFQVPPGTGMFGMVLILMSLGMLFAASMVAYVAIRFIGTSGPAPGSIHLPTGLWFSTVVLLISSMTFHHALRAVQLERQSAFRLAMLVTLLLAIAFLAIQGPCLFRLFQAHQAAKAANVFLYGLALMLIGLHAAHVVGGVIPIAIITARAFRGGYDHESHRGVKYGLVYWHFLDIVWVVMFAVLLLTKP